MFVQIKGVKRENFSGVWRAGRFWPSSEAIRVEVVNEEPPKIKEDILEHGKKVGSRDVSDMTKIGKATLEELKKDGRVSVLQDGETEGSASPQELEAARKTASAATSKLAALEAENAGLKEANEALMARISDLEGDAADSEAKDKSGKHHGKKS